MIVEEKERIKAAAAAAEGTPKPEGTHVHTMGFVVFNVFLF